MGLGVIDGGSIANGRTVELYFRRGGTAFVDYDCCLAILVWGSMCQRQRWSFERSVACFFTWSHSLFLTVNKGPRLFQWLARDI